MDAKSLMQRDLGRDVRAAAEAVDAEPAARWHLGPRQRPVPDNAGAQQRRRVLIVERFMQQIGVGLIGQARIGVSPVDVPARECRLDAQVLRAATTPGARSVCAAQPRHAHPVAHRESARTGAESVDAADNLMADGDLGMLGWQVTFGQVQVGTTDSAAADPDTDLAGARLRLRPVGAA